MYTLRIYVKNGSKWNLENTMSKSELDVFKAYFTAKNKCSLNSKITNLNYNASGDIIHMEITNTLELSSSDKKYKYVYDKEEE